MGIFQLDDDDSVIVIKGEKNLSLIKKEKWREFNSNVLGIGDISINPISRSVICAFFDLEGFTKFCNQIDPELVIPVFLKKYLDWFFIQIQDETKDTEYEEGIDTWHDLPLLVKFMGDGLLILWDVSNLGNTAQGNIIVSALTITKNYSRKFLPEIKKLVSEPPVKLRCGITRGRVYSVGDGSDYVGPCINFASRLQKLPGISFAFSNRGIVLEVIDSKVRNQFIEKVIGARGIGENELVYILEDDYNKMNDEDKQKYRDVEN